MSMSRALAPLLAGSLLCPLAVAADEWSGYFSGELRHFTQAPLDPHQAGDDLAFAAQPEYYREWDDRRQSLTLSLFGRWDREDKERRHLDIRELLWRKAAADWELRAGIGKVFWGVTESQHLVDIINQTDLVENIDTEDKLGQPLLQLSLIRDWGTLELFALPGFRERTFPGTQGRPRTQPRVDTALTTYESPKKQRHVDYAARWSHYLGDWDIGLAYFRGTGREPTLQPALTADGEPVLAPYYALIEQASLDLQATLGDWLWKLEAIHRSGQGAAFSAATGGFEYTLVGLFDSAWDLGLIGEYLWDERGANAPVLFEDDLMLGARLTPNDAQSTEILFGLILDRGDRSRMFNLEASRRLGEAWKLSIEARAFASIPTDSLFYGLRKDDYLQAELARYF